MDLGLKDKIAIVTGTNNSMGIGAATALALAGEGAKIAMIFKRVFMDFNADKTTDIGMDWYKAQVAGDAHKTEMALKDMGVSYMVMEADITDENAVKECFDAIEAELGPVDILINNSGLYADEDNILMVTDDDLNRVYGVNVKGTVFMMREFVTRYIDRHGASGRIVNLSTDAAEFVASSVVYGSSKAAVEALTCAVSLEVAHLGITVNAVAPGPIQTGWLDSVSEKAILPSIPVGRVGEPKDVANAILFLVSEKSSWITGQVLKVAGGHAL